MFSHANLPAYEVKSILMLQCPRFYELHVINNFQHKQYFVMKKKKI